MQLSSNRERQRQLEGRCGGDPDILSSKDRRELDTLVREERTLIRRQRLVEEAQGEGRSWLMKAWVKIEAVFRPVKLLGGLLLLLIAFATWVSMTLTAIDKAKNSVCKHRCGYILGHINVFNPINWIFVQSAKLFPVDYVIFTILALLFFSSSVIGIASIGIRFLWIRIFQIRKGHTSPQALLLATAMLMLTALALNYSLSMVVAPQYATFGPQTFCDRHSGLLDGQPDCSNSKYLIKPCSELADNSAAKRVCTPSVASTFLNRVTINFPFFGIVFFWAQFIFLGKRTLSSRTRTVLTSRCQVFIFSSSSLQCSALPSWTSVSSTRMQRRPKRRVFWRAPEDVSMPPGRMLRAELLKEMIGDKPQCLIFCSVNWHRRFLDGNVFYGYFPISCLAI